MTIQTATNPKTNETVALIDGAWKPVSQVATNKSGQKAFLVDNAWVSDAAPAPEPSFIDKAVSGTKDFVQKHGRELAGVGGSVVGGVLAVPEAVAAGIPTLGLGGLATEGAGIGLGGTIGTQLYDRLTGRKQTLLQQAGSAAQDFATNAAAAPAGRLIGAAVGAVAPAVKPLAEMLGRGRVAEATANEAAQLVEAVKQRALTAARGQEAVAKSGAQVEGRAAATKISQAKAAEAQLADALAKQEAAKAAAGSAKPFTAGKAATAGEQGAAQRTAVVAKREETLKPFVEADAKLRPEYEAAIAEKEAQGLSVADTPKAKAMLKESVDTMSPDPGTRPTVSAVPRSDTGGRMHEMIIDALQNNKVSLTKAEYEAAKEAGHEVSEMTVANGDIPGESSYSRTFKTPVEALDNLGRYFGEQAFGKGEASGFPAVSKNLLGKKYYQIQDVLNEFEPKRIPLQENWEAKLAADAPYKGTSVGKKALETVKKTDIPKATEEALAQTAFSSRQGYRDAKALAGPEAAKSGLLSRLTNLFHDPATGGPKPYDEVVRALAEGQGKLQGIIDEEPQVAALVKSHLQQLNDAKMMGVKATEFGDMAAKFKTEASGIRTSAGEKIASGQKLADTRRGFSKAINNLEIAKDSEAISQSHAIINGMLDKKFITSAQHKEFTVSIQKAEDAIAVAKTAAERKAARDKLVEIFAKGALATAGGGALYGVGKTAHDALF